MVEAPASLAWPLMVFVARHLRYDLPPAVAEHLGKPGVFIAEVPRDPDVIVVGKYGIYRLSGYNNWFAGRTAERVD
jgi:nucleotide-binding universal stress UspA family protein